MVQGSVSLNSRLNDGVLKELFTHHPAAHQPIPLQAKLEPADGPARGRAEPLLHGGSRQPPEPDSTSYRECHGQRDQGRACTGGWDQTAPGSVPVWSNW